MRFQVVARVKKGSEEKDIMVARSVGGVETGIRAFDMACRLVGHKHKHVKVLRAWVKIV